MMQVTRFVLGANFIPTNCYVMAADKHPESGRPCWIVDAGFQPAELIKFVMEKGFKPEAVILTHAHLDHIAGLPKLREQWPDLAIVIHDAEREWLTDPAKNLSAQYGVPFAAPAATWLLKGGETLTLGSSTWRVLHTPGHSPGSITLVNDESHTAIVGDTLFAGGVGRTDFPNCSFEELERSIREKQYVLPDQTRVLPGHGPETTIGREKASNPFVRA